MCRSGSPAFEVDLNPVFECKNNSSIFPRQTIPVRRRGRGSPSPPREPGPAGSMALGNAPRAAHTPSAAAAAPGPARLVKSCVTQQSAAAAPELTSPVRGSAAVKFMFLLEYEAEIHHFLLYIIQIHICSSTTCLCPARGKPAATCQAVTQRSRHCQDRLCSNTVSPKYLSVLCDLSGASETSVLDGVMQV